MSTITLSVKTTLDTRIDGSNLQPAALSALSVDEIARIELRAGNEALALGDLFDVAREDGEAPALVIEGDARRIDRLGANMSEGRLAVNGAAGDYAGLRMTGGTLTIHGNAGARLADRMRRGLVLVGGDAGDFAASRLIAGTVCIAGRVGAHYGYGMRRGTLLLMRDPGRLPPTFTEGGHGFQVFWSLFVRSLAREIAPFSALDPRVPPRRHAGDLAVDGRGELLIA